MKEIYWLNDESAKLGKGQRLIHDLSGSYSFCILPWIHLATRPNGDMRLCCNANSSGAGSDHEIGLVKNETGRPANFGKETPLSAWNNQYMRDVRRTMISGSIPKSCKKCYDEESKGVASKRIWETGTWIDNGIDIEELVANTTADGTVPEKLYYLDLRLGHTCNLKCIMCSPHDSSLWVTDQKKVYSQLVHPELKRQLHWSEDTFNHQWHENPLFWKEIYDQIPHIKQVYFAGGDPLAIKEHRYFLEEIIKRGYAHQITIRYNTNGLLLNDAIMNLWSKFKKVKVGFSLDGLEDKNYYIRYPSDWDTIVKNLHILDNASDNIEVSIAVAVQILNIKHLTTFAKWKIQQNFKKVNFENVTGGIEAGGGIFNMHLLYIPTFLSIKCLPKKDKDEVVAQFSEFKSWLRHNYRDDNDFWEVNPYGWKRWQALLDFMNSEDHTDLLPAFTEYIHKMDSIRKLDCKKTFPELAHLL